MSSRVLGMIRAAAGPAYLMMAILTYGHSVQKFVDIANPEARPRVLIAAVCLFSPISAVFWPLYWSALVFHREGEP